MPTYVLPGTALSIGVTLVALGLALWQWFDGRHRPESLSPEDHDHFRHQEARRWAVCGLMFALGILLLLGTHAPARVRHHPNVFFVEAWGAVLGIVVLLLVLAFQDWGSTRRYARRQRQAMAREGMAILRDEMRRRAALRHRAQAEEPAADESSGASSCP